MPLISVFRRQLQVDHCEFQASLVYILNSWPARAAQRDRVSKQNKTGNCQFCVHVPLHGAGPGSTPLSGERERDESAVWLSISEQNRTVVVTDEGKALAVL